ncbi:DNA repair protein RecN [Carboxylicivirga sediminis]|uniref:DNA repair protein RecN n=1 Tax=Carboxylicivirga sediminis TaxID=2006564 RepID=A0A941IY70_9BACT|nr:DNA repair protein RecN [Carboxylicivirga sediminis]MBR8536248.1 DNA repair protein RecN [Carboxylicivirga sediminis]
MLKSLSISNYALIDKVEVTFDGGLTVITGETGAGKSVLLGALSLILGQRSDVNALLNKEQKCVVEGEFYIGNYGLLDFFNEHDVDYEEVTIIRRELLPSGKSRAFVNDTPVNLGFLKSISAQLIDVHSQHQNLLLDDNGFHRMVVDTLAGNKTLLEEYRINYVAYKALQKEIEELIAENEKQKADLDYMQFQFEQLDSAKLQNGEQEEQEQLLEQLSHAEEIKMNLVEVVNNLSQEPAPVLGLLTDSVNKLGRIANYLPDGEELIQRLESARIDLKDLADDIEARSEDLDYNPELIQQVQERLNLIYSLQQKHRVDSVEKLMALRDELGQAIDKVNFFDDELKAKQGKLQQLEKELVKAGKAITKSRTGVFELVKSNIEKQLQTLGIPHANFVIQHQVSKHFTNDGVDEIEFLFSGNKGGRPSPINKVASGGEISRVMLSIKSLLSSSKGLPTIIFDEIDTGVSGEVADQMGGIMAQMGNSMQVISITHLPQITVKGDHHFKVFKTDEAEKTISNIRKLSHEDRVVEVAKMLSGSTLSEAAIENARSLLNN